MLEQNNDILSLCKIEKLCIIILLLVKSILVHLVEMVVMVHSYYPLIMYVRNEDGLHGRLVIQY